jgi:hypothetical protein
MSRAALGTKISPGETALCPTVRERGGEGRDESRDVRPTTRVRETARARGRAAGARGLGGPLPRNASGTQGAYRDPSGSIRTPKEFSKLLGTPYIVYMTRYAPVVRGDDPAVPYERSRCVSGCAVARSELCFSYYELSIDHSRASISSRSTVRSDDSRTSYIRYIPIHTDLRVR